MTDMMMNEMEIDTEALKEVVGGDVKESVDDFRFLNVLLQGKVDRYAPFRVQLGDHDGELVQGWAAVGIVAKIHTGNFFTQGDWNEYYLNGTELTRREAMQHAMIVTGRTLKESDWKW